MTFFRDVIGHTEVISHLQRAAAAGMVSHAYILNGPAHSGKRMIADAFAALLQCKSPSSEPEPCGECRPCRQAACESHPDILYLTHEKPLIISVDEVRRQICNDIDIRPYSGKYKIYIVEEAQKMNAQAQNALLKTIEEPPPYGVIMLLADNADSLLPTILSRCVRLNLKPVNNDLIVRHLMKNCRVPDYLASLCASFSQGNVGLAMLLASSERFFEFRDLSIQLICRAKTLSPGDIPAAIRSLDEYRDDIQDFFDFVLIWFRDVLLYKSTADVSLLICPDKIEEIRASARDYDISRIRGILNAVKTASARIKARVSYDLTLTMLLGEMGRERG